MLIQTEIRDRIARLTLNRPDRLNPLSFAMIAELTAALAAIAADPAVKVVVIAAQGRAFSAGHDLAELRAARAEPDGGAATLTRLFDDCARLMAQIRSAPQPVIAQVQGLAAAAGCQLVAACDIALAADTARFGVNGVNIGLFCSTPMVALTRNIGRKAAFEMLATGRFLTAAEAADAGLINRTVAPEALEAEAMGLAQTVAGKLGAALRIGKRTFHAQADLPVDQAYALAGAAMVENMQAPGTTEAISAFLDKRPAPPVD